MDDPKPGKSSGAPICFSPAKNADAESGNDISVPDTTPVHGDGRRPTT